MSKSPVKMTTTQLHRIRELYAEGIIPYQIAKKLNVPTGVVRYHIERIKLAVMPTLNPDKLNIEPTDSFYLTIIEKLKQKNKLLIEIVTEHMQH